MTQKKIITGKPRAPEWQHDLLTRQGFERCEDGYRRPGGNLLFTSSGTWSSISLPWEKGGDPLGVLGHPGPWKHIRSGDGGRFVFALPRFVMDEGSQMDPDDDGPDAAECEKEVPAAATCLESCIAFAVATAHGVAPAGWEPPDLATIDSWTRETGLTVQRESVVRQVEVIREPGRFALQVPLVPAIPENLPERRERWLRKLLIDCQDCWHLVRLGMTQESGQSAAIAEVDLTGVPRAISRRLFLASLDSLKAVVASLVETANFLIDPGSKSQVIDSSTLTDPTN